MNKTPIQNIIDYQDLYENLAESHLKKWLEVLPKQIEKILSPPPNTTGIHGNLVKWLKVLETLPDITPSIIDLNNKAIKIGEEKDISKDDLTKLEEQLRIFEPWRKGPYNLFSMEIDTEWRSDLKWDRLINKIDSLEGRRVLDVGCGSGYHGWRMLGENARLVIGIEPYLIYVMQHAAIKKYISSYSKNKNKPCPYHVLPITFEDVPTNLQGFDTVFSMGVLYHRKSPIEHLIGLKSALNPGGQLVLETLVVEGEKGYSFMPEHRYAKMANVWFIPSCDTLAFWLERCGYTDIELIDVSKTTFEEQRPTDWMKLESLPDFLDKDDINKTVEGYPAPLRAMFKAKKKK